MSSSKVGLLVSYTPKIPLLFKPHFKRFYSAFKLEFIIKEGIAKDSMLLSFRCVLNNLVDLYISKEGGSSSISNASTFRCILLQYLLNY